MLRKDIIKLKILLSGLFVGFNFFKVKSEKVIVKKHWWSITKSVYNLKDLLVNVIPSSILDPEVQRSYGEAINAYINTNDLSKAFESIYDIFITYIQNEKGFKGVRVENVSIAGRIKSWFESAYAARPGPLIQRHSEVTFVTVADTIKTKLKAATNVVGRVSTGNEKFDLQFLEICRYSVV